MIKADFHIHTNEDPKHPWIKYDSKKLIDVASERGYGAVSITNHDSIYFNKGLEKYAKTKGIILFPGIEKTVRRCHVLIINADKDAHKIKDFKDLYEYKKKKNVLIIAAHPSYGRSSIGRKCLKLRGLFDALEHSFYYTKIINPNNATMKWAKKLRVPVFADSDCHTIRFFDRNYTLINSKKNKNSIINAVKKGKIKIITAPIDHYPFFKLGVFLSLSSAKQIVAERFKQFYV